MSDRGSHLRGWLVVSRLSNLPTVWTNVLAGAVVAGAVVDRRAAAVAAAVSLLYVGGMVLNDVCDAAHDRFHRARRPIPSGTVSWNAAVAAAALLAATGVLLVWAVSVSSSGVWWALGLTATIAHYDVWHKRDPLAPLVMGVCRGLVYFVAAASLTGATPMALAGPALLLTVCVAGFTAGARYVPEVRPWVSWCIAAISLLDAGVLLWAGAPHWAAVAVLGMPLTLWWQRSIPGD